METMDKKLNWKNLADDRCPKCECKIYPDGKGMLKCALYGQGGRFDCDFQITPTKKDQIVSRVRLGVWSKQNDDDANLSALNNL